MMIYEGKTTLRLVSQTAAAPSLISHTGNLAQGIFQSKSQQELVVKHRSHDLLSLCFRRNCLVSPQLDRLHDC